MKKTTQKNSDLSIMVIVLTFLLAVIVVCVASEKVDITPILKTVIEAVFNLLVKYFCPIK